MARVRQIGLAGLKPHGDSTLYDVGIEHKGRLARLQVKSTTFIRERTLTCNMVGPGGNPTSGDAGFLRGVPGAGELVVHPPLFGGEPQEERVAAVHSGKSVAQI